jgi:hypothetical protein
MAEKLQAHAGHGFKSTHITHFDDGSAAIKHEHEGGPDHDVEHAVGNLDGIHDSLQDHLDPEKMEKGLKDEGKDPEALEEKVSPGIHDKVASLAGGAPATGEDKDAGTGNSPTHTSTETGGSSPGGASTGGVGSGIGGAGTGGAATGGASTSTGGAATGGTTTITISGSSSTETSTGSKSGKGGKGKEPKGAAPINITINSGATSGASDAKSADVKSGDGPGAGGSGGKGDGSGGGGGGGGGRGTPSHPEDASGAISPGVK